MGMLPAIDALLDHDKCLTLGPEVLSLMLESKLKRMHFKVVASRPGIDRFLTLNFTLKPYMDAFKPDVCLFVQQAPIRFAKPYVLRLIDQNIVEPDCNLVNKYHSLKDTLALRVKQLGFRYSLKRATCVVCASNALADSFAHWAPRFDARKIVASHFGLSYIARSNVRHVSRHTKRILTMHADPHKNIELILNALAHPNLKDWSLTVLADLNNAKSKYEYYLHDLIKDLGLQDRVYSAGFQTNKEELLERMQMHDVLVIPSILETWSHTVIEAMALGMPVIASDIAVHREVTSGAAKLVGIRDTLGLVEAISEVVNNPQMIRERIARGLEVVQRYDWMKYAAKVLECIRNAA
jgi:glycosyltransferase involved in cell wall biosynthesis